MTEIREIRRAVRPRLARQRGHPAGGARLRPGARARILRRRLRRLDRRVAAPRRGDLGDRRPAGGLAPRRRRRRRQDRRRRRHPPAGAARLLPRAHRAHRPHPERGPDGGRHGVPAAHRPRGPGALPDHRRVRDPEVRLLRLRLAPGAGRHRGDRRKGQRDPPGDRADHVLEPGRPVRDRFRARPLHHPPAHREGGARRAHHRFLHLLAVVPLDHLQGHVPGRAGGVVLPGPDRRALRLELRDLPPALFDQHLPDLAAGPAVPRARPQRRDQHRARQRELDGQPRDPHGARQFRRPRRGPEAGGAVGLVGFRVARRGVRADGAGRARAAHGQDHVHPRGLDRRRPDAAVVARSVRLRQRRDGAVGRPGGDRRLWRALGPGRHGPQRPAADALRGDPGRPADRRLGDRDGAGRRGHRGREGPARSRRHDRRRPGGRRPVPRQRAEGPAVVAQALRRVDQGKHQDRRADQGRARGEAGVLARGAAPPPGGRRLDAGGHGADPAADGRDRQGSGRLDGGRHPDRRAVRQVPRPAPFLPAEFQPGHQPADRQPARAPGDDPAHPARQPRQHPRRGFRAVRPPAAREPGADQRRVPRHARLHGGHRGRDRLHVPGRWRAERARGGDRAGPARGRGRGARRLHSRHPLGHGDLRRARRPADDPGHRCRPQPPGPPAAAHLHLGQRALRRVPGRALPGGADRRRRHHHQPLPRPGGDRRSPGSRPVRRRHPRGGARPLQEGDPGRPAEDHVEDGHLGAVLVPRRLQLRGGRPQPGAGGSVLPGHELADLRARPVGDPAEGPADARPGLRRGGGAAAGRRPVPLPPQR